MFARQAMSLVEFVSRFYGRNTKLRKCFSNELFKIEPKYFTSLPETAAPVTQEFELPRLRRKNILLWMLFDLIRNGIAHQYQQILVELPTKKYFYIQLSGPTHQRYLSSVSRSTHLGYAIESDCVLKVLLDPGILFLDLTYAVAKSDLLNKSSSFKHLIRPRSKTKFKPKSKTKTKPKPTYSFDIKSLEQSLLACNHHKLP